MPWAHASVQSSARLQGFAGANISLFPSSVGWAKLPQLQGHSACSHHSLCSKTGQQLASTGVLTAVMPPQNYIQGPRGQLHWEFCSTTG